MSGNAKTLVVLLLITVITAGAIIVWSRHTPNQPVEISLPPAPEFTGDISVSGAVNNPGLYPLRAEDSIEDVIQAAGGRTGITDISRLHLHVPEPAEIVSAQKIDINRAEAWLLQALPGIGAARAQAIVEHRLRNGPFRSGTELIAVQGIGSATYEQIAHLITVSDITIK